MDNTGAVDFLVVSDIQAQTKEEVIEIMVTYLDQHKYLHNKELFLHDVLEREHAVSTYIGHELGLPHNKSDGIRSSAVTVGRLAHPVIWTDEGDYVQTVFLIGVPKQNEGNMHLKILSKLARLLMHEQFRQEVIHADEQVLIDRLNHEVKSALEAEAIE